MRTLSYSVKLNSNDSASTGYHVGSYRNEELMSRCSDEGNIECPVKMTILDHYGTHPDIADVVGCITTLGDENEEQSKESFEREIADHLEEFLLGKYQGWQLTSFDVAAGLILPSYHHPDRNLYDSVIIELIGTIDVEFEVPGRNGGMEKYVIHQNAHDYHEGTLHITTVTEYINGVRRDIEFSGMRNDPIGSTCAKITEYVG